MSESDVRFVARFGLQQLWCVEESENVSKLELSCLWAAILAASAAFALPGEAAVKTAAKSNPKAEIAAKQQKSPVKKQKSPAVSPAVGGTEAIAKEGIEAAESSAERPEIPIEESSPANATEESATPSPLPAIAPEVENLANNTADRPLEELATSPTPDAVEEAVEEDPTPSANLLTVPPESVAQSSPTPEVLVAEVEIRGATTAELEDIAYGAIGTQPGRTTTRDQLIEDANAIYATGFFANVEPSAEDTPLGTRVVFTVTPNPVLNGVNVTGNQVLPPDKIDEFFSDQYGRILNFGDFQDGINRLNRWYQENGYVLAQVIDPPPTQEGPNLPPTVASDGTVTLEVAEGEIEAFRIRFRNEDGETEDADGNPIDGRTKDYVITREMRLQEGDVFNRTVLLDDLGRIVRLGLFEDAEFTIEPGTDPRKVVVVLNAVEGSFGSFNFGGGFSSATGLFGSVGAEFLNIGGRNQRLGGEAQVGTRGLFFDVRFTDPWIAGDPYRTSFSANIFNRRSISLVFDGSEEGDRRIIELDNGDRPRVQRLGGRVNFTRPLSFICPYSEEEAEKCDPIDRPALERPDWVASLGLEFENVSIRDGDGDIEPEDEEGNLLSFNDDGSDNLLNLQFGLSRDRRNSTLQPTDGSYLRFSTDQSIPIDGIFFNRVRAGYSYYIPVKFTDFADGPQALAFNIEAGTILGDLPPYEAFAIGGTNSVRGFEEGDVGVGRSFAQATVEYRFPVFSVIGGALFLDAATTFGSQGNVPGDPGGVRGKPGDGIGYGIGVRIQSPIGPIRIDYGLNNEGDNRFHFGIGERF